MGRKQCFKCGGVFPLTEFYRHPQMGDGHLGKCKACTRKDVRLNRSRKRDYYNEYDRARSKDRQKKRDSRKEQCRRVTRNAIKTGRLKVKSECERCGSSDRVQIHHPDYDFPMWVEFLCWRCHWDEHSKDGALPPQTPKGY
jgi:hypothetical protein